MKLIIQIPCYNEAETLAITLRALPRNLPGFDAVEWLIIDDGSTDETVSVAVGAGVDHVVRHTRNQGLARSFMNGLDASLRHGADVIVNTDADNQYDARDIPALVAPVLSGDADLVVGARPIGAIKHFSPVKKLLQRLGSKVVRIASGTDIPDAPSGFRAFSREAAEKTMVFNDYTYTLETIIQAGQNNMAIASVPVRVNEDLRPSRLLRSVPSYIKNSFVTIVRISIIYRPLRFLSFLAVLLIIPATALGIRYLVLLSMDPEAGHVQSLILAAILSISGFGTLLTGVLADLMAANRKLLEDIRFRMKRNDISGSRSLPER